MPSRSADCVLSVSGLSRAGDAAPETLQEVFRILRPGGLFVFVEPEKVGAQGQAVTDLIKRVFPEEIKVQQSPPSVTGDSSSGSGASLNDDEEFIRSRGKRGASKAKAARGGSSAVKEKVSLQTTTDSASDSDGSNGSQGDTSIANEAQKPSQDGVFRVSPAAGNSLKPGLVFETHNNLVNTYVSGIAVRPY